MSIFWDDEVPMTRVPRTPKINYEDMFANQCDDMADCLTVTPDGMEFTRNGKPVWSFGNNIRYGIDWCKEKPEDKIKKVIFSELYTIVLWEDGTKTMVKCNAEEIDYEKGLAMAIAKKFLGTNKNKSNYYDVFKKWLPKDKKEKISLYADDEKYLEVEIDEANETYIKELSKYDVPKIISDEIHEMAKQFRRPRKSKRKEK